METAPQPQQRFIWVIAVLLIGVLALFGYRVNQERVRVASSSKTPKPPQVLTTDPLRGNASAKITVMEYGDFQCPLCLSEQPALKVFVTKYQSVVRLVWKDFPITDLHPEAQHAAEAARCAQEQGKFWEMHDALFANQDQLGETLYLKLADDLQLDHTQFQNCLDSGKTLPLITAAQNDGSAAGVDGTPYFFFGTQRASELPTSDELDRFVTNALNQ